MFISIPLFIIVAAFLVLAFIVWRKWPFLKKLEPDAHTVGDSFVHDLAPEAVQRARAVHWRAFWNQMLQIIDEALHGIRAAFHAIGQASDRLRTSIQSVKHSIPEPQPVTSRPEPEQNKVAVPAPIDEAERKRLLKEEEQRLILDIAQDPKNVNLYVALGKVYTKLDNFADAAESFKTASKLDPDDDAIKERLKRAQERLEREEEREAKIKEQEAERDREQKEEDEKKENQEKSDEEPVN